MKLPFREFHLTQLYRDWREKSLPLDLVVHHYFKGHPALGSKDRAFLSESIFSLAKWHLLLEYFKITDPLEGIIFLDSDKFREAQQNPEIPAHIRVSCTEPLFQLLSDAYGESSAIELCQVFNTKAPTTIRVNSLKTSREEMLQRFSSDHKIVPTERSPWGITFQDKVHFASLPEFVAGLFEVQDEGSQLVAEMVQGEPGQWVLDYCAGAGGKTLAFAPRMQNRGQIFLHDIRGAALGEAKKRLARAGIQNAQSSPADDPKWKKHKKKMDWILVDAPCTGTGTLRRNPDMKWNFTEESLKQVVGQQRVIFEKALSFLKPTGKIVYATCSILPQENEQQIEHFLKTYSLKLVGEPLKILPKTGEMDGFFAAVMEG